MEMTVRREYCKWAGIAGTLLFSAAALIYAISGMTGAAFWSLLALGLIGMAAYLMEYRGDVLRMVRSRKARYGLNSVLYFLLILAAASFLQAILHNHDFSFDLTKNKIHTISDETAKTIKNLTQETKVLAFFNPADRQLENFENLLRKLKRLNPSKFNYEFVDMNKQPLLASQYAVRSSGTSVVVAGGRHESFSTSGEEELVNALLKVSADRTKIVRVLTGHGERSLDDSQAIGLSEFKKALEAATYQVHPLNLIEAKEVPADSSALVLAGPRTDYLQPELEILNRWLAKGGRMVVALDPRAPSANLSAWLKRAGVQVGNDVVVDTNPLNQLFGGGPIAPVIKNFDAAHPATKDIVQTGGQAVVPLARTVSLASSLPEGISGQSLMTTFPTAWAYKGTADHIPPRPSASDQKGPLTLAISIEADGKIFSKQPDEKAGERKTRLLVLGSSGLLANNALPAFNNQDFAVNGVRWLVDEEKRVAIAARNEDSTLLVLETARLRSIFWSLTLLVLGTLVTGAVVTVRRRRAV